MAHIQFKKVPWYRSIRTKLYVCMACLYITSSVIFGQLLFNIWENQWVNQRITEISRYANFLASDIAINRLIAENAEGQEGGETTAALNNELESFSRLYSYARVMILDERAMVIQDSSQTKVGRYIVNDDVLSALSGELINVRDGSFIRLAIPITDYSETRIQGAVYVFFTVDTMLQSLSITQGNVILLQYAVGMLVCAGMFLLISAFTKPFRKVQEWMKQVAAGNAEIPEELKRKDEYGAIVESVQGVTHDLIAIDHSRKEFVSNVSHELKTPLSSIKVLTESLLLQNSLPEEMYKEFLQDINSEIDRQTSIVNDLLTLVRLEEGGENVLNVSSFMLNDMTEDILKRLKPLAQEKNVELILESTRDVEIEADETKLTLALSNLIQNGIKYNKEGGQVRVTIDSDHMNAVIVVSDTGIGIEETHFAKLFQRFYRVDKARDREAGGSGLGLSIVRQIVMLHKGTISVESQVGEGSSFTARLPLIQTVEQEDEEE